MDVLIEKWVAAIQVTGRSPYMQSVYLEGSDNQLGRIVTVKIKEARQHSLAEVDERPKQTKPEENVA